MVSDGPTAGDMLEFWQMVWDEDVAIITMLTPPDAEVCQGHMHVM